MGHGARGAGGALVGVLSSHGLAERVAGGFHQAGISDFQLAPAQVLTLGDGVLQSVLGLDLVASVVVRLGKLGATGVGDAHPLAPQLPLHPFRKTPEDELCAIRAIRAIRAVTVRVVMPARLAVS
jgi:hypothetical protein